MPHGGYGNRRKPSSRSSKGKSIRSKGSGGVGKKPKAVSIKNQVRSIERLLSKDLRPEVREALEKKLEGLKKQQELHNRLAIERQIFLRDKKIKFFERRKIERRLRRLEKQQRSSTGQAQEADISEQLAKLKEDLEYVRFFPKTEKYVALFSGDEDGETVDRRNKLRKQIKENLVAAAASGKDLEETGSEDDGLIDISDDNFFAEGSSSDEADADDELTDKSAREQASSAFGRAASGMSGDERNQKQTSARGLMPPPRPSGNSRTRSTYASSRNGHPSSTTSSTRRSDFSTSSNASRNRNMPSSSDRGFSSSQTGHSSNLSSNSDAHKPRRKRRPKKKKD
ncbi:rRNA-processing protein efg1-like protein [Drosera capensis]